MHSTTKYIGGHGTSIGGIIVDGGNFDWEKHADRFPMLNKPDPSYHGAVWTQAVKPLGPIAYIIKARVTLLRDLGAAMSPVQRLPVHPGAGDAAAAHARSIAATRLPSRTISPSIRRSAKVIFPGLMTGEAKRRADAYLKGGYGGLLGFELKGGREAGRKFIDALKMFYHVANIGDARSLAIHPASTTHSQLTPEEQLQTGVTDGLCPAVGRHRAHRRHHRRSRSGARRCVDRCASEDGRHVGDCETPMLNRPFLLRIHPAVRSGQLDGHIGKENSRRVAVRRAPVI